MLLHVVTVWIWKFQILFVPLHSEKNEDAYYQP